MKKRCAELALSRITSSMTIGLGGGTTIGYLIEMIKGKQLDVKIVTPSYQTATLCREAGLQLVPTSQVTHLDVAFDGCDEVDENLNALKSMGGIHTVEKIIASMADEYILLVDESKVFKELAFSVPIVLEIIPEAQEKIKRELGTKGMRVIERTGEGNDGCTRTAHGNLLMEVHDLPTLPVKDLNETLAMTAGVVDTSLFYQIATSAIIVSETGNRRIERSKEV